MSPPSFAKVCVQHVKASFCGSVGCWKSVANKRCYTGCQKYMKSILRELQNNRTGKYTLNISTIAAAKRAKYSNDIHSALWPPEQHQPETGGPVALRPCSYSSMFPRQTLHINRNLLWGLFFSPPPPPALVPPAYQNTIARLHTNTTLAALVEEDIFWLRNQLPALLYKMTNLPCLAKIF